MAHYMPEDKNKLQQQITKQEKAINRKKRKPKKKDWGRPCKYRAAFNIRMINYFSIEPYYDRKDSFITGKKGYTKTQYKLTANKLPTFSGFARHIGVSVDTLNEWAKPENEAKYKGFSAAKKQCHDLQKDFLNTNALMGLYNATYSIFVATNITDMKNSYRGETGNKDGEKLIVNLVKPVELPNGNNTGPQQAATT